MKKLILLFPMLFILMGVSKCDSVNNKYSAPPFKDATIISYWDEEKQVDVATCFVIDDLITSDNFEQRVINHVSNYMKEHPLLEETINQLRTNKDNIVKTKEYEVTIAYCRGNSNIFPEDRTSLTKWSEANRIGRIKCEYGR